MEIKLNRAAVGNRAFTLMEVMLAVVIVGVEFVSLYVAISQGFAVVQSARENLRATQIMQEQVEIIRVLDWDKVTTTPSPWNFNASFYPSGGTNPGITYSGTIALTDAPVPGGGRSSRTSAQTARTVTALAAAFTAMAAVASGSMS